VLFRSAETTDWKPLCKGCSLGQQPFVCYGGHQMAQAKELDMWFRSFRNTGVYSNLRIVVAAVSGLVFLAYVLSSSSSSSGGRSGFLGKRAEGGETGIMEATQAVESGQPIDLGGVPPLPMMMYIVLIFAIGGVVFAGWLAQWVLSKDEGDKKMQEVSNAIREGAAGFLSTQYSMIFKLAFVVLIGIYLLYAARTPPRNLPGVEASSLALCVALSFFVGCVLSALSGYVGMWVAVRSNVRVASAATRSFQEAITVGLRAGAFSGILVVSMVLMGIIALLFIVRMIVPAARLHQLPFLLVGYSFGASFVALFAQLGGGIYTKAADVGADMVGKVEADIPEDDPRNPAVIADLVGDNVGDCAGRGADLFESIAGEILAAMILGGGLSKKLPADVQSGYTLFPLAIHAMDLVVSGVGIMMTECPKNAKISIVDPMEVLKSGYKISVALAGVGIVVLCRLLLHTDAHPLAWMHFALCGLIGLGTAFLFILVTQYYTDFNYPPVKQIAAASLTGHGTNVIAGMAVGMRATAAPAFIIGLALLSSYKIGRSAFGGVVSAGLFGTAVATMGMLSTVAFVLAMDVFGPITDNAGGIVEMSDQPEHVRDITDTLDAVGNTTKAITKGFSVGSACLACFLLFSAFLDEVAEIAGVPIQSVDLANPEVFLGGLAGSTLVFYFSGQCMTAVGNTAQEVVNNVRQQFRDKPGIMNGSQKPDYNSCVSIVTQAALREMIAPGLIAAIVPLSVGTFFRLVSSTDDPLIGAKAIAGFLMFATVTGVLLAIFLNTAGGAWDNAKKYIERGTHGGKGSDAHKAAVTGDTVGDPCKDTAGPSLHVLIKLLSTITLVCAPLFVADGHARTR